MSSASQGAEHYRRLWWIGDWALKAEGYGDLKAIAEEVEFEYGTVRDAQWVASKFELSRRRDNLPWSFHREVAQCTPERADELLDEWQSVVAWWRANVRKAHRPETNADRRYLPRAEAESITGITQQQVSRASRRLERRDEWQGVVTWWRANVRQRGNRPNVSDRKLLTVDEAEGRLSLTKLQVFRAARRLEKRDEWRAA